MRTRRRSLFVLIGLTAAMAFGFEWGCGGGGVGGSGQVSVGLSSSGSSTAALAIASADGSQTTSVDGIFLTIDKVEVHVSAKADDEHAEEVAENEAAEGNDVDSDVDHEADDEDGGSWVTVATPMQTFNLMDIQNCLLEKLGSAKLPAGEFVTQIRLVLGTTAIDGHPFANYVVINGSPEEIKVPSGSESGLKINLEKPVEIQEDGEVHVTLVIDPSKSLVFTGSGMILFKPVVKATVGGEAADAFVSGKVTSAADSSAIAGATVTATTTPNAAVENSATTGTDGSYRFCVAPGTYTVTATQTGFTPASTEITVIGDATATADFQLTPSNP